MTNPRMTAISRAMRIKYFIRTRDKYLAQHSGRYCWTTVQKAAIAFQSYADAFNVFSSNEFPNPGEMVSITRRVYLED